MLGIRYVHISSLEKEIPSGGSQAGNISQSCSLINTPDLSADRLLRVARGSQQAAPRTMRYAEKGYRDSCADNLLAHQVFLILLQCCSLFYVYA